MDGFIISEDTVRSGGVWCGKLRHGKFGFGAVG